MRNERKILKEIRIKRGYSLKYMAIKLGISKSYYWQIENNKRRLYYDFAYKVAKIFSLKPDDLFYQELVDNAN